MEQEKIKEIDKKYGTPFYVFDVDLFENNYRELYEAYSSVYSDFQIAYSFKTNYMPAACKRVKKLGGWAEVVSDMEYDMARLYGFAAKNIIVNGPGKWGGIEKMILDGALLMLDNENELKKVVEICEKHHIRANIGFRLNIDIGTNRISRFGFDVTSTYTKTIIDEAKKNSYLNIIGIHFHLGGARGLEAWANRAKKMLYYKDEYFGDNDLEIIDLGSGMFGHLHDSLASQFNQYIPSFSEYAMVVAGEFERYYSNKLQNKRPLLVVEPGATIIANTMKYVTKVIAVKEIRGRNIAIVDGSVHQLGELGKKKKLPMEVISSGNQGKKRLSNVDVAGYTCLEDDILIHSANDMIGDNDLICIENAGAYTNVMKPPFIQVGCKIIEIDKDSKLKLIKRQETVKDILSSYVVE